MSDSSEVVTIDCYNGRLHLEKPTTVYLIINTTCKTYSTTMSEKEYNVFYKWVTDRLPDTNSWCKINTKNKLIIIYKKYINSIEIYKNKETFLMNSKD